MPIANCYTHHLAVSNDQVRALTEEWAESIGVDLKDICLSFIEITHQTGQNYKVLVNLFLPTIWGSPGMEHVQISLDRVLKKHLNLKNEDVFIITISVQSGNVVDNGKTVRWNESE